MKVKLTVVKEDGTEIEVSVPIGELNSKNIIQSAEAEVCKMQEIFLPFLTERIIESHQSEFVGEKNQEEKREL